MKYWFAPPKRREANCEMEVTPNRLTPKLGPDYFPKAKALIDRLVKKTIRGGDLVDALCGFNGNDFTERVVEYPFFARWFLEHAERDSELLDVGCVLNHKSVSRLLSKRCRAVWFCNVAPEPVAITHLPFYYLLSDMNTAFQDGRQFPLVTCLSTIEHIGFDNSQYGDKTPARYSEPTLEPFLEALKHIARLTKPGGQFLVSVPFGRREVIEHPATGKIASQVFDFESLREGLTSLYAFRVIPKVSVFKATLNGWISVEPRHCDARYADGCVAAGAVALITGRKLDFDSQGVCGGAEISNKGVRTDAS